MLARKTKFLIISHRFLRDFTPFAPYMAIYFSEAGLSLSAISLLFIFWSATSIILEIPSGVLADRFDRKKILILAQLMKLIAFSVWLIAPNFAGFLVGLMLWGAAASLDSGTFQAFLFDLTRNTTAKSNFQKIYGKASSASFASLFAATLLAAATVQFGFPMLLILSIIGLSLSVLAIAAVPRPRQQVDVTLPETAVAKKGAIRSGFRYIISRKALLTLFVIGIAAAGLKAPLDEYHALFFENRGIPLFAIGLMVASFEAIKSVGALAAARVSVRDEQQKYLLLAIGTLFIIAAFASSFLAFVCLAVIILIDMALWIANDAAIQHRAADTNRATLASIKMFAGEVISVGLFAIFTLVSRIYPINSLYLLSGTLIVSTAVLIVILQSVAIRQTAHAKSNQVIKFLKKEAVQEQNRHLHHKASQLRR